MFSNVAILWADLLFFFVRLIIFNELKLNPCKAFLWDKGKSADPDKMLQNATPDRGLHRFLTECLY